MHKWNNKLMEEKNTSTLLSNWGSTNKDCETKTCTCNIVLIECFEQGFYVFYRRSSSMEEPFGPPCWNNV